MKMLSLHNILVATDLETTSDSALESARRLADLSGAELHIVHAAARATSVAVPDGVTLLSGPPGANITQEAVRTNADVIVLGAHRSRPTDLGSTADRVVRTAHVSCLILPGRLSLPLATVIVPVDIQNAAGPLKTGLTWASALRRRRMHTDRRDAPTRLIALHVFPDGSATEQVRARLHDEVAAINRELAHITGVEIEEQAATAEDVLARIHSLAEAEDADLIVLGTRAQRLDTAPLGSVSSAVVKRATKPVLLVPPEVWRPDTLPIS